VLLWFEFFFTKWVNSICCKSQSYITRFNCKLWPHNINVWLNFAINHMSNQSMKFNMASALNICFNHGMGMKWRWITLFGTFAQVTSLYHANPHFGQVYIHPSKQHTYTLLDIHGWFYSWGLPSLSKFLHGTYLQVKNSSMVVDTYARGTKIIQKFIANPQTHASWHLHMLVVLMWTYPHHKLARSMYLWFYNTLTMCLRLCVCESLKYNLNAHIKGLEDDDYEKIMGLSHINWKL
jgi:hypothetical protein